MKQSSNSKCYRANNGRYYRAIVIDILAAIAMILGFLAFILFICDIIVEDDGKFMPLLLGKTAVSCGLMYISYIITKWIDKTFW